MHVNIEWPKNTLQIWLKLRWPIVDHRPNGDIRYCLRMGPLHLSIEIVDWPSTPLVYANLSKKILKPKPVTAREISEDLCRIVSRWPARRSGPNLFANWKVTHKQHLIAPLRIDLHWRGLLTLVSTCLWEFIQEVAPVQDNSTARAHRSTRELTATRHRTGPNLCFQMESYS